MEGGVLLLVVTLKGIEGGNNYMWELRNIII